MIAALNQKSLTSKARRLILNKALTLYPPSLTNCFSDSACSTPATVDGAVGGLVDGSGYVGPELVSNNFAVPATYLNTISVSTSNSFTSINSGGGLGRVYFNLPAGSAGMVYKVSFSTTSSAGFFFRAGTDGNGTVLYSNASSGVTSFYVVATAANNCLLFTGNTNETFSVSNISVRQVNPIATQTTAGFKPVLRKGAVNLLLWSSDFSNAVWNTNADTITRSAGSLIETAALGIHRMGYAIGPTTGVDKRFYIEVKAAGRTKARGWSFSTGDTSAQIFDLVTGIATGSQSPIMRALGDGWYSCSFIVPAANNTAVTFGPSDGTLNTNSYTGDGVSGIQVRNAMMSFGTAEVPYVATTTAPASNLNGNYWLDFDGVDDRLVLSSAPSNNDVIILGCRPKTVANTSPVGAGNTGTTYAACFKYRSDGSIRSRVQNVSGVVTDALSSAGLYTAGLSHISTLAYDQSNIKLRFNGVQAASTANTTDPTGAESYSMGRGGSIVSELFSGAIYALCLGKATLTDKEALLIEKYLAKLTDGVTI